MTYIATIAHHSIRRARSIAITGSLDEAKRAAAAEFGGEQRDYEIRIYDARACRYTGELIADQIVARRYVAARSWA